MSRGDDMAYPTPQADTPNNTIQCGLTIREHFAALAMQGILAGPHSQLHYDKNSPTTMAFEAVAMADKLLAELSKVTP